MKYLVELKQDSQNNSILVRETELDQYCIVRGWRVRHETHTFSSLEEVSNFILSNNDVTDRFFCMHEENKKELMKLIEE